MNRYDSKDGFPIYRFYRLGIVVSCKIKIVSKIAGITSIVSRKILQELNLGQDLAVTTCDN